MPVFIRLICLLASLFLLSCESYIGVKTAPEKTAKYELSPAREDAVDLFWEVFLSGQYDRISQVLTALKAAYLANPNDPELASSPILPRAQLTDVLLWAGTGRCSRPWAR